jgi:hypothetical protein
MTTIAEALALAGLKQGGRAAQQPDLPRPVRTEALLDQQLSLLTTALTETLSRAREADLSQDDQAFRSQGEIANALKLAKTSTELALARAKLKGETHVRYQVLRVEGKAAARLARNDYWPEGMTEEEATTLSDEEIIERMGLPPRPSRRLDPRNEPEERRPPLDPDLPNITPEEMQSEEGWQRFIVRWEAAKAAKAAKAAAEAAAKAEAALAELNRPLDDEDEDAAPSPSPSKL